MDEAADGTINTSAGFPVEHLRMLLGQGQGGGGGMTSLGLVGSRGTNPGSVSLSTCVNSLKTVSIFSSCDTESHVEDLDLKGFSGVPSPLLSLPFSATFQVLERGKPFF